MSRHVKAILALPFMVTIVVPALIFRSTHSFQYVWRQTFAGMTAGCFFLIAGLALFISTNFFFASIGKGTLAPWDPPQKFVVRGPYCHVRNPMITGVVCLLSAEAFLFHSLLLLCWAVLFFRGAHFFIVFFEEPQLARRFGEDYLRYKKNVPRWLPRKTPWENDQKTVKKD